MGRVLMVSGDMGSFNIQFPVYEKLRELGVDVEVAVDSDERALAGKKWSKKGIEFSSPKTLAEFKWFVEKADVIFVGSCATCNEKQIFAVNYGRTLGKTTVVGADMWPNHWRKAWREVKSDFWLAIDEVHQRDILSRRPHLEEKRVPILGQPAFDSLAKLIKNRDEVRREMREKFDITNKERVLLFWSLGDSRKRCNDAVSSLLSTIAQVCKDNQTVLIPRLHGKLRKTVSNEYFEFQHEIIASFAKTHGVRLVRADNEDTEKLNFVADLVMTQWSTEGIKSAISGIPTINVLLESHRKYLEEELEQFEPYLPTIDCRLARLVKDLNVIDFYISVVMDSRRRPKNNMLPQGNSAQKIAEFLKGLL